MNLQAQIRIFAWKTLRYSKKSPLMSRLILTYLPYGVIDLLLTLAIISEIINKRYDLLWANLPILIWGLVSLNKKVRRLNHDLVD